MLLDSLKKREFEHSLSVAQHAFYWAERSVGHHLFRRPPPQIVGEALLNLGCGPHIFEGWVNADDYAIKRSFRQRAFRPSWRLDITRAWTCPDNTWDGVFSEHVLEMLTYSDAVFVLTECLRTLKPSGRIRISLPDLKQYVALYQGNGDPAGYPDFPDPVLAVAFLTQMHFHRSTWDARLMMRLLTEIGFEKAAEAAYCKGEDPRLLRDDEDKAHDSFYVEARKPG